MVIESEIKEISSQLAQQASALATLADKMVSKKENAASASIETDVNSLVAYLGLGQEQADEELLHSVLNCAMHVVKASGAGLTLFDHDKQRLIFRAAIGDGAEGVVGYEVPLEGSQHGLAFATGETQSSTPLHTDIEEQAGVTFRNMLVAPLIAGEDTIGTISAVNKVGQDNFSRDDIDAYHYFAALAAQILSRQLKEEVVRNMISGKPVQAVGELNSDIFGMDQTLMFKLLINIMSISRERPDLLESCLYFTDTLLGTGSSSHPSR